MNNNDSYIHTGTSLQADAVVDLINRSGFFGGFNQDDIKILTGWIKAYSVPAGSFILREGKADNCLCVLVDGAVDIYKETEPDKHLKIASVRPHESIGEMGVVDGEPFSASVIASKDSLVLIMTKEDFDALVSHHEGLGVRLLRKISTIISSRLRRTTGRLADLLANK